MIVVSGVNVPLKDARTDYQHGVVKKGTLSKGRCLDEWWSVRANERARWAREWSEEGY